MGLEKGTGKIGGNKTLADAGNFFDNGPKGKIVVIGPKNFGNLVVGDNLALMRD